ncbi:uncharacterized protein L3040_006099 [Drepanopeziza brunnea f. sp. 'multigermtubi']|uniref:uncharacterized protein n=1 Tax=Drepanopeziza brunnea f. sp. 'multigermtubi' TaxID=698441 RepID=UPI00238E4CE2|nr:hypothetical protein L3040_006099 [Drepanopeziza brunnea f. sp. 'multigermtubi']
MVQSLRRPIFTALRASPSSFLHSAPQRCLSQTPLRQFPKDRSQQQLPRQAPQRSLRVAQKEQAGQVTLASDFGLLEETFVTPSRRNYPSPLKTPRVFASLLWRHLKIRFRDRVSMYVLWATSPREQGRRFWNRSLKIQRRAIAPTALALHQQMYTAFAEGNLPALRKICTDGIFESFRARIASRPRSERVEWELVKYLGGPKVISHRGGKMQLEGNSVRQAVVRVRSRQRLTRTVGGKVVDGSGREKDVTEFVVLQRIMRDSSEGPWQVWGTTKETTLEDLVEWDKKAGRILD